jgi:hypothetical protein
MRIRTALVAAGVATAGLLAPASPAQAAPVPFVAVVNCDAASGTIKVGTAGGTGYATGSEFTPNMPVTVEFQTLRTSWSTTTTDGTTPPGNKITVSATTDAKGGLTITGYTKPWRGKSYQFYGETVRATVRNAQGQYLTYRDGTCTRDVRTVVTLTCDRDGHAITARVTGSRFTRNAWTSVEYTYTSTYQASADSGRWTRRNTSPPDVVHTAKPVDGEWSDVGFTHPVKDDPYYLSETVFVEVRHPHGYVIGRGTASCVYADQGA